jgi:hypothetical protein
MIYLKTASLPPKRQILNNNINLLWFLFEIKGLLFHKGVGGFPYCKASSIYHHCNVKIQYNLPRKNSNAKSWNT